MLLNGVLEGKCYMATQKAAFIVSGRYCGGTWLFISVKVTSVQLGVLGCLIPCVYGLSGTFETLWCVSVRKRQEKAASGVFFMDVIMDKVRDEALNSAFKA